MNFKTERQKDDVYKLSLYNPQLYKLLVILDNFTQFEFGKEFVVTDVFRTKEEFDALYAATPVDKRPTDSPHCHWEAVDLRSTTFTDSEIKTMLTFLNCFKNPSGKPTALYHTIAGNAFHFHIQRGK